MTAKRINLLVVLGPTASGKTALGVHLARLLGGEIISADSRQVYRELDLGAGKDREEYRRGGPEVPCHLIDVVGLDTEYSVFHYQRDCYRVLDELWRRRVLPIMVGGSGLYLEAVLLGYQLVEVPPDPERRRRLEAFSHEQLVEYLRRLQGGRLHATTDTCSRARLLRAIEIAEVSARKPPPPAPRLQPLVLGIDFTTAELRRRIAARLRRRLEQGLVEEVAGLLERGVAPERLDALGLEYRYLVRYLQGRYPSLEQMRVQLERAIAAFAKRQRTWFRRMARRGVTIHWLAGADTRQAERLVREYLPDTGQPPKAG